jgi:hypothetical protein
MMIQSWKQQGLWRILAKSEGEQLKSFLDLDLNFRILLCLGQNGYDYGYIGSVNDVGNHD